MVLLLCAVALAGTATYVAFLKLRIEDALYSQDMTRYSWAYTPAPQK